MSSLSLETRPDSCTDPQTERLSAGIVWLHPSLSFVSLDARSVTLGRDPSCSVILPGERVSRLHARITKKGPLHLLSDAGSTNGTLVNGERITTVPLSDNDVVKVGSNVGVVVSAPDFPSPLFREPAPGVIVGPRSQQLWQRLAEIADSDSSVVFEGETGTGKEVLSKALHRASSRNGPFIAVNCATLPEGLADAQLFGHARGAFTGANNAVPGLFEAAHGGTLLLDEVTDLGAAQQAKLLRVLEERAVNRIGETTTRPVNVRLIVASQYSLVEMVNAGRFRADLMARIAGSTLRLAPLSQRREEILPVFMNVFEHHGADPTTLSSGFCEALCLQQWPLNMRQLAHLARQAASLAKQGTRLRRGSLPRLIELVYGVDPSPPATGGRSTQTALTSTPSEHGQAAEAVVGARRAAWFARHRHELTAFMAALEETGGNVSGAARKAGITRQRAARLMNIHEALSKPR